jgi:3-isopropylmalate/(R)-2-methylmalate dehydratase small subunit
MAEGSDHLITGKAYVLGDDIDTDQIIPAEYLAYDPSDPEERKYFGKYANAGVPPAEAGLPAGNVPFIEGGAFTSGYTFIIGGKNFGCGSSREHAPLALAEAGIQAVIAEFYARIFFRNSVNGGYVLPIETPERLIDGAIETGDELSLDLVTQTLTNVTRGTAHELRPLGEVKPIIDAGGVFGYAKATGMLKS